MPGLTPRRKGPKGKKPIEMDSDYEDVLSEQFDTFVSENSPSKMGAYNNIN
jgi:hypothetical protein